MIKNQTREKAVLVAVAIPQNAKTIDEDLSELKRLAQTAGAEVVAVFKQIREHFVPAYVIGLGKLKEIASYVHSNKIDTIIFYNDLSQSQRRNISKVVNCKVIDRTELILDIFALHARTLEAKLQVELAQHMYRLSHLTGKGLQLMQQTGGIGTRGPGEKKLEIDRRRIRERITKLKRDLSKIRSQRATRRARRLSLPTPTASLIGYTNAGKSTLMRALTKANVLVEDKLFATLTTTTRRLVLPDKRIILISDTVGFIKNLPPHLIASFRSTLEEAETSDLLIHVIDASSENVIEQYNAVINILDELHFDENVEIINVLNKADVTPPEKLKRLLSEIPDAVTISALTGKGIDALIAKIVQKLDRFYMRMEMTFDLVKEADIIAKIKGSCHIIDEHYMKNNLLKLTFVGHKNIINRILTRKGEQ